MVNSVKNIFLSICFLTLSLYSCKGPEKKEKNDEKIETGTPVTVTRIGADALTEYTDLSATATFLQKNYVKANVNGYIQAVNAAPGKFVNGGQTLFVIKTKEAQSLDNTVNKLDPTFKFSGVNNIKASATGYITQLNHQAGDYVQDGEQLAVISNQNSFAFILNLPYELKQYLNTNGTVDMTLPDGTKLKGRVTESMPSVDAATQTLNVVIKVPEADKLPENLIAKVRIVKINKASALSLPKAAILTNDVQSEFWVMKMLDSVTAVKVSIKKGIETNERVEILEPVFTADDKILITGNYGLPDTAKVRVDNNK
jgi:multidrug efflux pump subunit AcrA (membrane-fusion protein)